MSTGLKITKATYGAGSKTVDVTQVVSKSVKDGSINLVITPDSLNVKDPAPGQLKTLNVSYTINNGSVNTQSVRDNEVFMVSAPPERNASGLQIIKAEYGYQGNYTDVTYAVQNLVSDGSIKLTVGFKEVGIPDPNPNKQKELKVNYSLNGAENTEVFKDGQIFNINAPAGEAVSNNTPSTDANAVWGVITGNAILFLKIFLHIVSTYTLAKFMDPSGSAMYKVAAFCIPWGSFWALPLYLFFRRILFTSEVSLPDMSYVKAI